MNYTAESKLGDKLSRFRAELECYRRESRKKSDDMAAFDNESETRLAIFGRERL